ncbi:hypothetical protein PINS_up011892 [Pythium insidiosum]|nr:hypothetical protein PINS_up011892 [Pythium insidiosum]
MMMKKKTPPECTPVTGVGAVTNGVERLTLSVTDDVVSPTSSSSSNRSQAEPFSLPTVDCVDDGELVATLHPPTLDSRSTHLIPDTAVSAQNAADDSPRRPRRQSDETELQFGDLDDDFAGRRIAEDDTEVLRRGRLAMALDLDGVAPGGMNGPASATRKTSSSFSDLGDFDDFGDMTPNGTPNTPNTPTFRSLYDAHNSSFGSRSSFSSISNGHYVSPMMNRPSGGSTSSSNRYGRNGRMTPTTRVGAPLDETQPLAGSIMPVTGEVLRTEVENAAYIIFFKCDEVEKEDGASVVSSLSSSPSSTSSDGNYDNDVVSIAENGEISPAFCRPPRSLISLGAAGHKVRTTNCFTQEYAHPTRSLGRGLFRASTSVGSAFLKGAAGLVNQTYQGGANGGVFGFAKGLGMGMLGLGTHTVKGAFRGVGQVTDVVGEMVMGTAPHFSIDGMLLLTNYRLIWVSQGVHDAMEIPLASIVSIDSSTTAPHVINIECKSLLRMSIAFRDESTAHELLGSVWELYSEPRYVFANIHYQALLVRGDSSTSSDTVATSVDLFYDAEADYRRIKLLDETCWMRLFDNSDFSLFPSYPSQFVVPAELEDEDLRELSSYRSASRIPAVVWRHPHVGALLCRCAQPCAGISGYVVPADQKFVTAMQRATCGRDDAKFHFFDARSQMAATANSAQGKGTEDTRNYPNTELHFCDIANIHAVRSSFIALSAICQPGEDREGSDWEFQLRNSFWFLHLSRILVSAQVVCETMCQAESVMVHCSDGWDRTPQLTGLVQLLLDPFYRTLQGVLFLIEKEWCSFGHMFRTRYSHCEAPGQQEVEEQSPVFVQWLDALWQIWRQQPWAFEFNEMLLTTMYDHVFSGIYGSFLYNSECERKQREKVAPTRSLWSAIMADREEYLNAEYDAAKNFNSVGIILPFSADEEDMVLWDKHVASADPICRKYQ